MIQDMLRRAAFTFTEFLAVLVIIAVIVGIGARALSHRDTFKEAIVWSIAAILAGVAVGREVARDRTRIPPQSCRQCGYNLTGNTSGVCPECGTAISD